MTANTPLENKRYNHAFDFAFEIHTDKPSREVTGAELRAGLLARIAGMPDSEFKEACDCFDTIGEE